MNKTQHNATNPSDEVLKYARRIAEMKSLQQDTTPFLVMDVGEVERMLDEWPKHLPRVQPFYSVDCNASEELLHSLATHPTMVGFCCNSRVNVDNALEHLPSSAILYANACWTRASLQKAERQGVNLLTFESEAELERILFSHSNAELLLSVRMPGNPSEDPLAQMGCPVERVRELLQYAADMGAHVIGLGFHLGDRPAHGLFTSALECAREILLQGDRMGHRMSVLNMGDGLPTMGADFVSLTTHISCELNRLFPREHFGELKIIATPGRFFANTAFSLVSAVIGRQSVDASHITGDEFDAGYKAFVYETTEGYYGAFASQIRSSCPTLKCESLFECNDLPTTYATVLGPSADEFDVLLPVCHLRPLSVGEWLFWPGMGAYSMNNCDGLNEEDDAPSSPAIYCAGLRERRASFDEAVVPYMKMLTDEADDDGAGSCGISASLSSLGEEESMRCESVEPPHYADLEDDYVGFADWLLQE